ncbi:MAG: MFS transporter, partial [Sulfuricaulis sp.]
MEPSKVVETKPSSHVSLYPILAVNFVGTLGFSIVLPFLVYLVTKLGGNALVYGVMGATYSFFQLLGAPVLGHLSDRYGRRRILLLSQVGTLVSWGIFLVALWLPVRPWFEVHSALLGVFMLTVPLIVLFFARALDGITGGNVSVANAYLADISDDTNRSANFGKMAVSANLGFILGPA